MKVLIFILMYLLIGYVIDLLITKGKQKTLWIMPIIWPFFLFISVVIVLSEMGSEDK